MLATAKASGDSTSNSSRADTRYGSHQPRRVSSHMISSALSCESALAVWAIGGERIIDIHGLEDASGERDFIAFQVVGVAAAILLFVMPPDNGQDAAEGFQGRTDALSDDGMILHELSLEGVQWTGFQQHVLGHSNLANVVHDSTAPQVGANLPRQSNFFGERNGGTRQPVAVAFGVGIFRFDAARQRAQHGLRVFQLIRIALQPHERSHSRQQLFLLHRLVQKVVCARLNATDAVFRAGEPGNEHHGKKPRFRPGLDRAAYREPRGSRHHHVEQHQIHGLGAGFPKRLLAILGRNHAVAVQPKQFGQRRADTFIVVRNENGSLE